MQIRFYDVPLVVMARCGRCGVMEDVTQWPSMKGSPEIDLVHPLPAPREGWAIIPWRGTRVWGCAKCAGEWKRLLEDAEGTFTAQRPA